MDLIVVLGKLTEHFNGNLKNYGFQNAATRGSSCSLKLKYFLMVSFCIKKPICFQIGFFS